MSSEKYFSTASQDVFKARHGLKWFSLKIYLLVAAGHTIGFFSSFIQFYINLAGSFWILTSETVPGLSSGWGAQTITKETQTLV